MADLFSSYDITGVLYEMGVLRHIDYAFANFIYSEEVSENKRVTSLLSALLSYSTTRCNNVCIDLNKPLSFFDSVNLDLNSESNQRFADVCSDILDILSDVNYFEIFSKSKTVSVCPEISMISKPLVYSNNKLYLAKYWEAEEIIALSIKERLGSKEDLSNIKLLSSLEKIYDRFSDYNKTWGQHVAVFTALRSNFSIITGGPGTGKTTVVAVILALFFIQNPKSKVALVAPTGKAQARLKEAVFEELEYLNISEEIKGLIRSIEFKTVHSLLGVRRGKEHKKTRLRYDLIVVDESSMVGVLIFKLLFDSLNIFTKLVLLGDRDQLAAVEGGAILSDLCASVNELNKFSSNFVNDFLAIMSSDLNLPQVANSTRLLQDNIASLEYTFRFSSLSGIGCMKEKLLTSQADFEKFMYSDYVNYNDSLTVCKFKSVIPSINQEQLWSFIEKWTNVIDGKPTKFLSYLEAESVTEAYRIFSEFQIVTPLNKGMIGVESINNLLISKLAMNVDGVKGLPVMIEKNDYHTGLFNGDIGIFWPDKNGELKVWFPFDTESSSSEVKGFTAFSPAKIPLYSPAFAMTIHKSQGSGFGSVLLALPAVESEILTKELLYTAITRAKQKLVIFGSIDSVVNASKINVCRESGLIDKVL